MCIASYRKASIITASSETNGIARRKRRHRKYERDVKVFRDASRWRMGGGVGRYEMAKREYRIQIRCSSVWRRCRPLKRHRT